MTDEQEQDSDDGTLTFEQVVRYGTEISKLPIHGRFVTVVANEDGTKFSEAVGTVEDRYAGSILVEYRRMCDGKWFRETWAHEAHIIPVTEPKPATTTATTGE